MAKLSIRDAAIANVVAAIFLFTTAGAWAGSALIKSNAMTVLAPLPQSAAETLYKIGRYDLLRESAVSCERSFNQLATTSLSAQVAADWTTAVVALLSFAMLAFNVWYLSGTKRQLDVTRNPST